MLTTPATTIKKSSIKASLLDALLNNFPHTDNAQRTARVSEDNNAKPFVQWVGGKREMIAQYRKFFPTDFNKYFEPFLGGGAMFFDIEPSAAILGDNNPELIRAYEGVRDNPETVIDLLKKLKTRHSKELYMSIRGFDRTIDILSELTSAEIAARMIYLNQTCFNGVYRVNKKGQFNVPIGSSLDRLICDEWAIRKDSQVLKKTTIKCADFEELLEEAGENDFIYFDPPYFPVSVYSDFTRYTKEKFYKEDQQRLKDFIDILTKKGSKVMLSNSDCEFINDLYANYKRRVVYSSRALNCKKDRRGRVSELLITNY